MVEKEPQTVEDKRQPQTHYKKPKNHTKTFTIPQKEQSSHVHQEKEEARFQEAPHRLKQNGEPAHAEDAEEEEILRKYGSKPVYEEPEVEPGKFFMLNL